MGARDHRRTPVGSVAFEQQPNGKGEGLIWAEALALNRLTAMRRDGENYSDVILRLFSTGAAISRLRRLRPSAIGRCARSTGSF